MDIDCRQQELFKLRSYIEDINKETAMLLQNLQWDSKSLLKSTTMVSCQYEGSHRMPSSSKEAHEKLCYLAKHGYSKDDVLLPDPVDPEADTIVKFSKQDIMEIINAAAYSNPSFKRIESGPEPLSAARLQLAYSADERRALHDAVAAAAPALCELADDLAVPGAAARRSSRPKHWAEVLAEQRDMKRRRAKYRGAAHTDNYSHTLRGLIKSQMELYAEARGIFIKTEYGSKNYVSLNSRPSGSQASEETTASSGVIVKEERVTPDDNGTRIEERSRDRDRRIERGEREPSSKRRRDDRDNEVFSPSYTHKGRSPIRDKYTAKERRRYHDYHSKRSHNNYKDKPDERYRDSLDDNRKDRNNHNYDGSRDRGSNVRYYDSYKDKYAGSSREHSKHDKRYRDSSKTDKRDGYIGIKRERDTNDSESHREFKRKPYCDVQIKQEKNNDGY